ncbi:MAG: DoxX family protein [Lacipirellulaceae bacterium]
MTLKSKSRITGWVLTALVFLLLVGPSAMSKFLDWEGKEAAFAKAGFTVELMQKIGVLEVAIALLYLIPRTSFLGSILLTGYLGGAVVTHLRVGEPWFMPVVIGVVAWIGCALRTPGVFGLTLGGQAPRSATLS